MNERIKELAEQAKFMAEEDINRQISYNAELKAFAEKFAELIVRECMKVSRGADGMDATHEAWYLIEQHFGIGMSTEDKKTLIKELLGVKNETNQ
jgi:hypothetical protein